MSDSWLRFISQDPAYQPSAKAADMAVGLVEHLLPDADEVSIAFSEAVQFVDAGGNWSGVECPHCSCDLEEWWLDAMSTAAETEFRQLQVSTPCCERQVSLNDLRYPWQVGFARFVLSVMNPNVSDLSEDHERAIAKCLGSPLRKIWAHI